MMLVDTHCHLTSAGLVERVGDVLTAARQAGVTRFITVAVHPDDARAALDLMRRYPEIHLVAGVHPHEAEKCTPQLFETMRSLLRGDGLTDDLKARVVGVGETGIDLHYDFASPERQEDVFEAHLQLATDLALPVVIHARRAEERVCEMLARFPGLAGRVVFHCFSGEPEIAERVLELGCHCSFTGVVTFKKSDVIRASAQIVPLDRMMVETDAPYLSPEPVRNIRPNEPALLVHTARFLAGLLGVDEEEFAARTTANAERFFGLVRE